MGLSPGKIPKMTLGIDSLEEITDEVLISQFVFLFIIPSCANTEYRWFFPSESCHNYLGQNLLSILYALCLPFSVPSFSLSAFSKYKI